MDRVEFNQQVARLAVLMPPARDPEEVDRRTVLTEELWRRFNAVPSSTWAAIVARVIDTHTRAGPPRPADFTAAEDFLREKTVGQAGGGGYRPPTKAETDEWCLNEIRTMKPKNARYVLSRLEIDPRFKLSDAVIQALLLKAGEDSGPTDTTPVDIMDPLKRAPYLNQKTMGRNDQIRAVVGDMKDPPPLVDEPDIPF